MAWRLVHWCCGGVVVSLCRTYPRTILMTYLCYKCVGTVLGQYHSSARRELVLYSRGTGAVPAHVQVQHREIAVPSVVPVQSQHNGTVPANCQHTATAVPAQHQRVQYQDSTSTVLANRVCSNSTVPV